MNGRKQISHAILALILIFGSVFDAIPAWANVGNLGAANWNLVNPLPTGNTLSGVTYGSGLFVAVGSNGTILTSATGTSWINQTSGTANALLGVACGVDGNGGVLFAAVGNGGTILTSADGTNWVSRTSGTAADIKGITYGGGQFAAVGNSGTILTSADGITWKSITNSGMPHTASALYGITCGSDSRGRSNFVAVGSGGTILTSPDGETWSDYSDSSVSTDDLLGVACGLDSNCDSLYAAVGSNGTILTSADGTAWTKATNPIPAANLKGIIYGGGQFVAVGDSGTILVSAAGTAWTSKTSNTSNNLYGVACGSNYYVAVGQNGTMLYSETARAAGAAVITSVRDTGSQGNGSDMEVSFSKAADESLVSEYRIMVVPVSESFNFNVIKANAIPAGNYTAVNKTGSNITLALANTATDIDGSLIENDSSYKVFILSAADGVNVTVNTLSEPSSEVTLKMWNWANPKPTGNTFHGTAYGNSRYVVVGDSGAIYTSPDGTNWTSRTSDTSYDLNGVAYGKGMFVAVGYMGTAVTSPDGTRWTYNDNASNILSLGASMEAVAYGKGLFVAVCSDGTILTSPDGVTWISRMNSVYLNAVTYGANGYFVGVGNSGTIMTSPDGITWTNQTSNTSKSLYGVTWGISGYVAVGDSGTILASADGTSWSSVASPVVDLIEAVTYGNGYYLAISSSTILTSSNGTNWTTGNSGTTNCLYGVGCGNGLFVAAGDYGTIITSADGALWNTRSSGILNYINGVIYDGSRFIAVGNGAVLTSADGTAWDSQSGVGEYCLNGVVCGENADHQKLYVAVGDNGYPSSQGLILTSADGTSWSSQALSTTNSNFAGVLSDSNTTLRGVACGNGVYVAVGYNGDGTGNHGAILTSTDDGNTWTSRTDNSWNYLYSVAYGNGLFVAVGYNGIILTSGDGATWTVQAASGSSYSDTLNGISYINGLFVAVGYGGKIWTSSDGVSWNKDYYASSNFTGVTYGNGIYLAVGDSGTIRTSTDLVSWAWRGCDPGTKNALYGASYGNGVYVTVGADGTILTSGSGSTQIPTMANPANKKWDFKINQTTSGVTRLSGLSRVDTALAIVKANYTGKVANVILATADNYPDALAGSVLAHKLNAPILLVGSSDADQEKILNYMKSNLDPAGTVYILGGTGVISSAMESKVTASGFQNVTRLGGADRYDTSVKIAEQLEVKTGTPVVLVSGENYPDALSISSVAAIMQNPILLVQKDGFSGTVRQEIAAIKPAKVYIIGGQGVISPAVADQVAQLTGLAQANIVRIGGADRYETSLAVAQYFNFAGQNVCVATGNNFPDALAGSAYAANFNAPIILADGSLTDKAMNYLKTRKLTGATIFGGEAVVSKDIEQQLLQLIGK